MAVQTDLRTDAGRDEHQDAGLREELDAELREEAIERLRKKEGLRAHLLVYALTNGLLWIIWALLTPGLFAWPALVTGGWGIGVVMSVWELYGRRPVTEAEVEHEIERLRKV